MKNITYNDKLNAIMAYSFGVFLYPLLIKDKSSFLTAHLRRGKIINIALLIWIIVMVALYRVLNFMTFFTSETVNLIKLILYILSGIFCLLILIYQIYWFIKIIRKKAK